MISEKQTTQGFVTSKQSLQGNITIGRPLATIKVNEIEGGHKITVTDPSGVQELNIMDGVDGKDATVTATNIKTALNYTPAKQADVDNLSKEIADQQTQINLKQPKGNYALKEEIPNTLPNPQKLTFKLGGTTYEYDGNSAVSIAIEDASEVAY